MDAKHPARFYHANALLRVFANVGSATEQTQALIRLAEIAYGRRDYEALHELINWLAAFPSATAHRAAAYYAAILLKRAGQFAAAAAILAPISAPRALHTLGTIEECRGNWTEATRLHVEAMQAARR